MSVTVHRLTGEDLPGYTQMLHVFAAGFEDAESYLSAPPDAARMTHRLADPFFIALLAEVDGTPAGALAAYVLEKFEQDRREVYLYDLAVMPGLRRRGVASALIAKLQQIAGEMQAYVIFVQADHGDDPAIALYSRLGRREEVLHFDIDPA